MPPPTCFIHRHKTVPKRLPQEEEVLASGQIWTFSCFRMQGINGAPFVYNGLLMLFRQIIDRKSLSMDLRKYFSAKWAETLWFFVNKLSFVFCILWISSSLWIFKCPTIFFHFNCWLINWLLDLFVCLLSVNLFCLLWICMFVHQFISPFAFYLYLFQFSLCCLL